MEAEGKNLSIQMFYQFCSTLDLIFIAGQITGCINRTFFFIGVPLLLEEHKHVLSSARKLVQKGTSHNDGQRKQMCLYVLFELLLFPQSRNGLFESMNWLKNGNRELKCHLVALSINSIYGQQNNIFIQFKEQDRLPRSPELSFKLDFKQEMSKSLKGEGWKKSE